MTARQEVTALCVALAGFALAMLGMVAVVVHEADSAQARFVDERSVRVRIEDRCAADAAGGGLCQPGTFEPATSTTSAP